jgi:phage internal scaffolding protein
MEFVSAYSPKVKCDTVNLEESMTKQSFKDDCDINVILKRYNMEAGLNSMMDYRQYYESNFEDVSAATDLQDAFNRVQEANEAFDAMPSNIRSRFYNDPRMLLEFLGDSANREEAIALGLLEKPKVEVAQ